MFPCPTHSCFIYNMPRFASFWYKNKFQSASLPSNIPIYTPRNFSPLCKDFVAKWLLRMIRNHLSSEARVRITSKSLFFVLFFLLRWVLVMSLVVLGWWFGFLPFPSLSTPFQPISTSFTSFYPLHHTSHLTLYTSQNLIFP